MPMSGSLRDFLMLLGDVFNRARPHGIHRAKSIVVAVRSFVRFLGVTGRCPPGMEHAIPGFASWQLASVPRFLVTEEIERVIDSCNDYLFGIRDRPVLLLLARLGLRASEVAQLKFADINWRNGSIILCGKARRQESLPLPQEVGDAILLYLNQGRPSLRVPEVFTSVLAPIRALSRAAVTHIVRSALRRAGIKAPVNGAHVLRHSAATAMLRQGCVPGWSRCGPATPVSYDNGSLRQSGLRSLVRNRSAMAGGVLMLIAHVERDVFEELLEGHLRDRDDFHALVDSVLDDIEVVWH
jgi:integrase